MDIWKTLKEIINRSKIIDDKLKRDLKRYLESLIYVKEDIENERIIYVNSEEFFEKYIDKEILNSIIKNFENSKEFKTDEDKNYVISEIKKYIEEEK